MAIHAGLNLNDELSLRVGLLLQRRSVFHRYSETVVRRCGGRTSLGGLEDVGAGSFAKHGAAIVDFLGILARQFVIILVELPCEVGLY